MPNSDENLDGFARRLLRLPKTAHLFNILLPPHNESGAAMLIDAYDMNITKCAMTEDVKRASSVIHAD